MVKVAKLCPYCNKRHYKEAKVRKCAMKNKRKTEKWARVKV